MFGGTPQRNMVNTTDKDMPIDWSIKKDAQKNIRWVAELGSVAAVIGYRFARTFRIPDQAPRLPSALQSPGARAGAFAREVLAERRFLGFVARHAIYSFGLSMAVPLIPLYYVRELGASDVWIGLIGTTQATLTMAGYFLWRQPARRPVDVG